jgi:AraC family L-rhamnose operon regulatory protein RhaS
MFRSLQQLFVRLANELEEQKDGFWSCRSRSYLIEILFLLQRIFLVPDPDSEILLNNNSEFVGQAMLFLHANYSRKITMVELSRRLNMNRTTLNERFREETGMTATTYLIDLRIRLACQMLRDTLIPVSEIASRVGFNDTAHFTRTFRKLTLCSPSDYRQSNSWQMK